MKEYKIDASENHSFNVNVATTIGSIEKAIILKDIKGWCEINMLNKHNCHDGRYWTYNSSDALAAKYPYMKSRSIRRWLSELVEDGYLFDGCYNKVQYDRTKWYSINHEKYLEAAKTLTGQNGQWNGQSGQSNGQNGQPIPSHTNLSISQRKIGTFEFDPEKGPRGVQLVNHAVEQTKAYINKYGESHITSHVEKYQLGWSEEETKAEIEEMWRHYSTEKEVALHCVEDYLHKLWPRWCKTASERQKRSGKKSAPAVSMTEYGDGYPAHLKRSHERYLARSQKYYPTLTDSRCRLLSPDEFLTFFDNLPSFWPVNQAAEYVNKLQKELDGDKWKRKDHSSVYEYLTKQVATKAQGTKSLTPLLEALS